MTRDGSQPGESQAIHDAQDLSDEQRVAALKTLLLDRTSSSESGTASFFDTLYGDV